MSWAQSTRFFWLAAVLFPPLGLVLLWTRPGAKIPTRLAGTVAMFVLAVAHLYFLWGLRVELDGAATQPIFYFGDRASQYAQLEAERARQVEQLPPPESAATEPAPVAETAALVADVIENDPPVPPAHSAYWTDYRGPQRDGHYTQTPILTDWPEGKLEELWRHPVGGGYASFVVADDRAFTIEQRRNQEVVAAYDMEFGRELWTNAWDANFRNAEGGPGPRATPTWSDGRVYALGAEGELRAIDATTGATIWRRNILRENNAQNAEWAMAASPLVVDGKVIVLPGGRDASVVAYDKGTGDAVWKALSDQQAYTAPMLATLAGQRQIIVVSASRAVGLTVEDGSLLWEYPWRTSFDVNAAQPVITGPDTVFLSAGYGHGATLVRVTRDGDGFTASRVWETNRMKNKFSSSVFYDGYIYGFDEAIFACLDAATGKLKWKGGRYGYGQVLLADGHLIITSERGDVALVKATPESHQEIARFSAVDGKTWNTPALADGRLLVRNAREMVCYRIGG